jgi:XapX domain-containing protein
VKASLISLAACLGVGVICGLIRVKSPVPPIIALLGLLGMVFAEQLGIWIRAKKLNVSQVARCALSVSDMIASSSLKCVGAEKRNYRFA